MNIVDNFYYDNDTIDTDKHVTYFVVYLGENKKLL